MESPVRFKDQEEVDAIIRRIATHSGEEPSIVRRALALYTLIAAEDRALGYRKEMAQPWWKRW